MNKTELNKELSGETLRAADKRLLVVAHRGCSGRAPENTVAAFEMALEFGADMIECDVRLTKDDEVVVFHDRTLNRTTDGGGPVEERTLEDLKKLDAGSWFSRRFSGERIPTLNEVLCLLEGRAFLNIELKADSRKRRSHVLLEERVLQAVKSTKRNDGFSSVPSITD
ncbi:MAG: glycerophosphodiester phosphodiesterase family protein [Bacteroidota bacterium]